MSAQSELLALADRVEALTGPCRETDAKIAVAVDGGEIVWKAANYTMELYPARRHVSKNHVGGYGNAPVPAYTASLDAAMTLVPDDGFTLATVRHLWGDEPDQRAGYAIINKYRRDEGCEGGKLFDATHTGNAFTPALALTAAALRAKATGQ